MCVEMESPEQILGSIQISRRLGLGPYKEGVAYDGLQCQAVATRGIVITDLL